MSNTPQRTTSQYRMSRQGFEPLANNTSVSMRPGDATIDIPLEKLENQSPTSAGIDGSYTPLANIPTRRATTQSATERKGMFRGRRMVRFDSKGQRTGRIGPDGEEDTINRLGMMYKKIRDSSVLTRYLIYVAPLALCIAVPIVIGATVAKDARLGGVRILWFFTWIEIVWLSLWASKIVAHYLPFFFQLGAGVVSSGTRKYALVLRSLEIPLSLVGWALSSLATFTPVMTKAGADTEKQHWETIMSEILAAALISTLILLGEKTFVQLLSINYHRKQFYDKIRDSKRNIHLLGLLYDASRKMFPAFCNEFAEEDYTIIDQLNLMALRGSRGKNHARSGSATPGRILQDIGRFNDKVTSAFGNVAQEITGKEVFNPNSAHSIVVEALERKAATEALARRIWMSFVVEGHEALHYDDIVDVLGENYRVEADEAFAALDRDGNGDVSLDEMILTIAEFGRERKSITSSILDVDQAINVLDRMLITVVGIVVILVFVAFLNKSFVTTLATAGTALLSLSFVFSVTAQEVLGSCIFLFVKHPYDIGDRVDVGTDNTNQFVVDHISLLFTVFRRVSGINTGRTVQIPNIVLNTLWVENVSRSRAMKEQLTLNISFDTSFADIQTLKTELLSFVMDKDNARDFQPELEVEVLGTADMSGLQLRVEMRTKSNWANETIRAARRSKFMCALVQALRRVPIYGPGGGSDALGSAANAQYSVTISDQIAKKNAEDAAKAKEASRLVPTPIDTVTKDADGDTPPLGLTVIEEQVIDDLNSRRPNSDPARDEAWTSSRDDGSTLGERPSVDRQDIEEVRGLLHRESTRGKRRPRDLSRMTSPGVPSIPEPQAPIAQSAYGQQAEASMAVDRYEQQRSLAAGLAAPSLGSPPPTSPSAYVPPPIAQDVDTSYTSPLSRSRTQDRQQAGETRQMSRLPNPSFGQPLQSASSTQSSGSNNAQPSTAYQNQMSAAGAAYLTQSSAPGANSAFGGN